MLAEWLSFVWSQSQSLTHRDTHRGRITLNVGLTSTNYMDIANTCKLE